MKTALLVVDIQEALIHGRPYRAAEFLDTIRMLLAAARQSKTEVIYVRHDGGPGSPLAANSAGWNIYAPIAPLPTEKIFDKKYSSSFYGTGLKEYLHAQAIGELVLVGMQTEYCIDATCKAAFEHGFSVVVPSGATTTFDNEVFSAEALVPYYERRIWNGRFAQVVPPEEAVRILDGSAAK